LREVVQILLRHAQLLAEWIGEGPAIRAFRRHATWYTKGFRDSAGLRQHVTSVQTYEQLVHAFDAINLDQPFPPSAMRVPRGKSSGTQQVSLPEGYLDELDNDAPPCAEAEDEFSGG
jgi:hypothetical protein